MQDNFDLKGYLRHGNKLLNEGIGGYFDLIPLKEEENDMATIELDMSWDESNPEEDKAAKDAFDKFGIEVSGGTGRPGTYEVTGRKEDILSYLRSEFYGMDEEAIKQYYPELLGGEMTELEKPEKIYADDSFVQAQRDAAERDYSDIKPPRPDSSDYDRMFDLGGDQIEKGITFLLDDGFDPEDVLEMCKMFVEAHSEANDQGKKF